MSVLEPLLSKASVRCHSQASSRKRVLQELAESLTAPGASEDDLFDGLMARERLGSTGMGKGVAIPHCRADVADINLAVLTTEEPVDYEAPDGQGVDVFFALVVPNDEHEAHLGALAEIAGVLSSESNRHQLRGCQSAAALYDEARALLTDAAAP